MSLPMNCQEKTGFLILHKCKNAADSQCSKCGKYLCNKHTHIHASAPICLSCLKKESTEEYNRAYTSRYSYRSGYYHGYTPFMYSRYSDRDYNDFDRDAEGFHDDAGGS